MNIEPLIPYYLWLAVAMFVVTFIVQLVAPVTVYERAKDSNLSVIHKGLFATTVEALYEIKQKGLDADGKYWWHITWFNTTVSLSVSALVVFGAIVITVIVVVVVMVIVGLIALSVFFSD